MWTGVYAKELRLREAEMKTLALLGHHSTLSREGTMMSMASSLALLPSQRLSKMVSMRRGAVLP